MIHALVPVKSLHAAKSRLSPVLALEERQQLVLAMLQDVLATLRAVPELASVSVVTADARVAAAALRAGAVVRAESAAGLNGALTNAAAEANRNGASAVLLLFADLPLATPAEIRALLRHRQHADVVLGAARDGGTNAMLVPVPLPMPLLFGAHSLQRHQHAARERGLCVATVQSAGLEHDIDQPEDVARLAGSGATTAAGCLAQEFMLGACCG